MPVDDNFRALVVAALDWTLPEGLSCAVLAQTTDPPSLEVLLRRESDGYSGKVEILLDSAPLGMQAGLDLAVSRFLQFGACECPDCRARALPSLDAAAAEFEANVARIGGQS